MAYWGWRPIVFIRRPIGALREILRRGALWLSSIPRGLQCFGWDHRGRNRFIAAHAQAVYVAEADVMSGSLGTAAWSYQLGKQKLVSRRPGWGACVLA
ncbi:MAG: DNA-processing protein DprA [Myxococcota bacterium]